MVRGAKTHAGRKEAPPPKIGREVHSIPKPALRERERARTSRTNLAPPYTNTQESQDKLKSEMRCVEIIQQKYCTKGGGGGGGGVGGGGRVGGYNHTPLDAKNATSSYFS